MLNTKDKINNSENVEDEILSIAEFNAILNDLDDIEEEFLDNPDSIIETLTQIEQALSDPDFIERLEAEAEADSDFDLDFDFDFDFDSDLDFDYSEDDGSAPDSSEGLGGGALGSTTGGDVPLTELSLDHPEQWAMGWTNYRNVYEDSQNMLPIWTASLTNADEATKQFWPMIATYGLVYNLLVLQKIGDTQYDQLKTAFEFDGQLGEKLDNLQKAGRLYVIDLSIFKVLKQNMVGGVKRFTPSTITLLQQDAESKAITPLAIRVAGYEDTNAQIYLRDSAAGEKQATDSAWLYALQAAKVSVTVYGIWLGHVYHWHIVTAAMQQTMKDTFSSFHPIRQLLAPQSESLIEFNVLLLKYWNHLAPPTSIKDGKEFLQLCNKFAENRQFFDDDPLTTLERLGLKQVDFTKTEDKPWELYPIVPRYLKIWQATEEYVNTFIKEKYDEIKNDDYLFDELKEWYKSSKEKGNIRGLPENMEREGLKKVLTSLIYRVTMHGVSRLNSHALPALTFVANFPPCLQSSEIPEPSASFDTKTLLSYLPTTGTIGGMIKFYFIFVFSKPDKPFIPSKGSDHNLFFGKDRKDPCNKALIDYRNEVKDMIERIQNSPPNNPWPKNEELRKQQIHQWPLNIET